MLTTDFVTMARAADRARPSPYPNAWRVRNLTLAAVPLGSFRLLYLVAVLGVGWYWLRLSPGEMQTLTFTMLVFAGQGNVYVLRDARPSLAFAPRADHAAGLTLRCRAGRRSRRRRRADEPASDHRDRPARRDDDRLHPGDGLHQARGVRAPANRLNLRRGWITPGGGEQSGGWRRPVFEQVQDADRVSFTELDAFSASNSPQPGTKSASWPPSRSTRAGSCTDLSVCDIVKMK